MCDVDGCTSFAIIYGYLRDLTHFNKEPLNITYSMNKGKKHGIIVNNIPKDVDLLIIPDSGTNDYKEAEILQEEYSIDILILDHHNFEDDYYKKPEINNVVVINDQDGVYKNNTLSGAGVVYKFIKEYDKKYGYDYADDYLDLCAIGNIGDLMDLRNFETRYLVLKGLSFIGNQLFREILTKEGIFEDSERLKVDDDPEVKISHVGWNLAPKINACIRYGSEEERQDMLKALIGIKEIREYKPKKSKNNPNPQVEQQTLEKFMARVLSNIHSRQSSKVKKYMNKLIEIIEEQYLNDNKIIVIDSSDIIEESTFTGLVANKLAEYYKRPCLVLREFDKDTFGGSGRNYELCEIDNLNKALKGLNCFEEVAGHDNSFGIKIKKNNIEKMIKSFNETYKDMKIEDVYLCDYEIPVGRLKEKDILQIGKWDNIWGGEGLKEPLFAITNITLDQKDIKLVGEKRTTIRFQKSIGSNSITFIKFRTNEEEYNKMIMKNKSAITSKKSTKLTLDVIGKMKVNEYNGSLFPQIEVVDFNVSKAKDIRF